MLHNTLCQSVFPTKCVFDGFKVPCPSWTHSLKEGLFDFFVLHKSGPRIRIPWCIPNVTGFVQIEAGPSQTTEKICLCFTVSMIIFFLQSHHIAGENCNYDKIKSLFLYLNLHNLYLVHCSLRGTMHLVHYNTSCNNLCSESTYR